MHGPFCVHDRHEKDRALQNGKIDGSVFLSGTKVALTKVNNQTTMRQYIINKNRQDSESGLNYEVHDLTTNACNRLPLPSNRIDLGFHNGCEGALNEAKQRFPAQRYEIDGCFYCCEECHDE